MLKKKNLLPLNVFTIVNVTIMTKGPGLLIGVQIFLNFI